MQSGKQILTSAPHQSKHLVETIRAAIIGIRYIPGRVGQQQPQVSPGIAGLSLKRCQVVPVHGDKDIKGLKVFGADLPGALGRQIDAVGGPQPRPSEDPADVPCARTRCRRTQW